MGELYRTDPRKFFEYSLHDTRLLVKLEDKLKYLQLAVTMARKATIKYNDVLGTIKYLEHAVLNHCHFDRKEMLVIPNLNEDNTRDGLTGAFVVDTIPGVYGWSCSTDIASLYPSTIRALNLSPETHVFQCTSKFDDFVKIVENDCNDIIDLIYIPTGECIQLPVNEVREMIDDNNYTISANGSIMDTSKRGIIPEILDIWYYERRDMKNLSKDYKKSGDLVKAEYYNNMQNLRKIGLNSLYGAISNQFCRFYTLNIAASITLTGQVIEMQQIYRANEFVNKFKK